MNGAFLSGSREEVDESERLVAANSASDGMDITNTCSHEKESYNPVLRDDPPAAVATPGQPIPANRLALDKQIQAAAEYQRSLRRQRRRRYICFIGFIVLAVLFTVSFVAYAIVAGVAPKIPDSDEDNSAAMHHGHGHSVPHSPGHRTLKVHLDSIRNGRMSPRQSRWRKRIFFWKRHERGSDAKISAAPASPTVPLHGPASIPTRTTFAVKKAIHMPLQGA